MNKTLLLIIISSSSRRVHQTLLTFFEKKSTNKDNILILIDDAKNKCDLNALELEQKCGVRSGQILRSQRRFGYGGCLRLGFRYALDHDYDFIVTLPVEFLLKTRDFEPRFLPEPNHASVDVWLGTGSAFPLIWTSPLRFLQSFLFLFINPVIGGLSGVCIKRWNASVRMYRVSALKRVLFEFNTFELHFDVEILLQLFKKEGNITVFSMSVAWPHLFSIKNVWNSFKTALKYRLQNYNLFFDVRYNPQFIQALEENHHHETLYENKLDEKSPHQILFTHPSLVKDGSQVLDIGCSTGYICEELSKKKNCVVTGVDMLPPASVKSDNFQYIQMDLEHQSEKIGDLIKNGDYDSVLMLDVLEHLSKPELFMWHLYKKNPSKAPRFLFSTANIAFVVNRLMLLMGFFNYGEKGILDITHKRLFTPRSFKNLFEQTGFLILRKYYFPVPFRKLGISPGLASIFQKFHSCLIFLWPSLFAYQMMYEVTPVVSTSTAIKEAVVGLGKEDS